MMRSTAPLAPAGFENGLRRGSGLEGSGIEPIQERLPQADVEQIPSSQQFENTGRDAGREACRLRCRRG